MIVPGQNVMAWDDGVCVENEISFNWQRILKIIK
jgi:hypothetical protein